MCEDRKGEGVILCMGVSESVPPRQWIDPKCINISFSKIFTLRYSLDTCRHTIHNNSKAFS